MRVYFNFPTVAIYAMKWDVSELIAKGEWGVPQMPAVSQVDESTAFFSVVLESAGAKKIDVIKLVRELTGLGLSESKSLVESLPKPIKASLSKEEAELVRDRFSAIGATTVLQKE